MDTHPPARGVGRATGPFEHVSSPNNATRALVRFCGERLLVGRGKGRAWAGGRSPRAAPAGSVAPVTSARCSWPTTDRGPRSRFRASDGVQGAGPSRGQGGAATRFAIAGQNGYHGRDGWTRFRFGDCGLLRRSPSAVVSRHQARRLAHRRGPDDARWIRPAGDEWAAIEAALAAEWPASSRRSSTNRWLQPRGKMQLLQAPTSCGRPAGTWSRRAGRVS